MRRRKRLVAAGVVVGLLACTANLGIGAPFREVPPTIGAYTLRGGEWQIAGEMGLLLSPPSYSRAGISVAYGLTPWVQMTIAMGHGVAADPQFSYLTYATSAKFRLTFGPFLDLGIPLGVWFTDSGMGTQFGAVHSGSTLTARVGRKLTLHGSVIIGFARQGFFYGLEGSVDLDLLPNLKLVAELGLLPFALTFDVWLRPLSFVDLKLTVTPLALSVVGGVYLRF